MDKYQAPASPWGGRTSIHQESASPPVVSFSEILSEELAEELESEELTGLQNRLNPGASEAHEESPPEEQNEDADFAMALELQREFDREYDIFVRLENGKQDKRGGKTVTITPERYCGRRSESDDAAPSGSTEHDLDAREAAAHSYYARADQQQSSEFASSPTSSSTTKHDLVQSARRNCDKTLNDNMLSVSVGDVVGERISNRIYNKLRDFSHQERKREVRVRDKEEHAQHSDVDRSTRLVLFKWINQGVIDSVQGFVATGKESVVLHAVGSLDAAGLAATNADGLAATNADEPLAQVEEKPEEDQEDEDEEEGGSVEDAGGSLFACSNTLRAQDRGDSRHFAIKIYKQTLSKFKNRGDYVRDDYRFKNPRRVLRVWAEKEFMNLTRMFTAGVACPQPIQLRRNVMLMAMVQDDDGRPAPKLKAVSWRDAAHASDAYKQVEQLMTDLMARCRLVHADLSEFNILYAAGERCVLVDVGQAVDVSHPRHLVMLARDVNNILAFFEKIGTPDLPSPHELFERITGMSTPENEALEETVEKFELQNRNMQLRHDKTHPADYELRTMHQEAKGRRPARDYE